ncbi:MAG: STAS domain-containing protein, partial [Acidobacteriota bacterium]
TRADVVLLDGASLACLTDISRIMSRRKGTLRLVGLPGRLERLVNMVGLSRLMEVSRDRPSCR